MMHCSSENFDYYKYNGLGNDYIVIDPNKTQFLMNGPIIRLICNRNFGIGSDGILYGPTLRNNQFHLRIFNPDGSEAEKSGNGLRIFSRYLKDTGYVNSDKFQVWTPAGANDIEINGKGIQVNMGIPNFKSQEIPVAGEEREVMEERILIGDEEILINCVSVGNPHCVILSDELSESRVRKLGPILESNPIFPNKINVQFMKVINRAKVGIMIWERGAGYTLASGSSSTAAASVARKLDLIDDDVLVQMPGGNLNIAFDESGNAYMTGPVTSVTKGHFLEDFLNQINSLMEE